MWLPREIAGRTFEVLDLEHPDVAAPILADIERGDKVYYDRRWRVSERFATHLAKTPDAVRDRKVLVLGCGVGLESLAVAPHAAFLWLNDASATAVELSRRQLARNGFQQHEPLVGRYERVDLPRFDVAIGSFLVYDDQTREAVLAFMARTSQPIILANESMEVFDDLVHGSGRRIRRMDDAPSTRVVLFEPPS